MTGSRQSLGVTLQRRGSDRLATHHELWTFPPTLLSLDRHQSSHQYSSEESLQQHNPPNRIGAQQALCITDGNIGGENKCPLGLKIPLTKCAQYRRSAVHGEQPALTDHMQMKCNQGAACVSQGTEAGVTLNRLCSGNGALSCGACTDGSPFVLRGPDRCVTGDLWMSSNGRSTGVHASRAARQTISNATCVMAPRAHCSISTMLDHESDARRRNFTAGDG
jgi:hypothetical protein